MGDINLKNPKNMSQIKNKNTESAGSEEFTGLAEDTVEQLKMAGQVQKNFLPGRLPNSDTLRWATVFEPADWVSGDIYDIARLDEQHIGFYIADAVGHSMPAALLTMFLKHALTMRQTKGNQYQIFTPAEVITNLNDKMLAQHLTGCLFATCCYCLLNITTLQLTYARAGHPYPVLINPGADPRQLQCRGGLLGVFNDAEFEEQSTQLTPGDKLFLYSDGCEQLVGTCDDEGEFAFSNQFYSVIKMPVEQMMSQFRSLAENNAPPKSQIDDMTAIGLEILQ
ncbi:MAG TPA: serine/threonine-protein phosphatase [Planctomycetes bacterium]|nr:serine/threonine-protein phosphatase [Planctomycetota bacterium]